mmetsp:Transcript_62177/g.116337  ORF Transcript_62177/g.116337 Transcript_62177/m.116337 type:complete len:223 (-) Transcript_62177:149-817(-)
MEQMTCPLSHARARGTRKALLITASVAAFTALVCPQSFASPGSIPDDRISVDSLEIGMEVDAMILNKHRFSGWFANIGTDNPAFLEFEEACDGFPKDGMSTWLRGSSLSARVLEKDGQKVFLTMRSGSLERPKRFRTPPSEDQIAAFSDVPATDWFDAEVCGMFPKGVWIKMASPDGEFRTLLRKEEFEESFTESCHIGMKIKVRVLEADVNKKRLFVTMRP